MYRAYCRVVFDCAAYCDQKKRESIMEMFEREGYKTIEVNNKEYFIGRDR